MLSGILQRKLIDWFLYGGTGEYQKTLSLVMRQKGKS